MRRIKVDDNIKSLIATALGGEAPANVENFGVFEAISVTTRPINKMGSFFDKATITKATLQQMADRLNAGMNVPFHTLHEQGYEIPVGRNFKATVVDTPDGFSNLHTLYWIDPTEDKLIQKLDNGTVEEVSVSLLTEKMTCSGCSFDYMAGENRYALYDRTCDNGHVLGMGEYHLVLDGMKSWPETSVVSKGASIGNKVLGAKERLMASSNAAGVQLSSSDIPFMLTASPTLPVPTTPNPVTPPTLSAEEMKEIDDLTKLVNQLSETVTAQAEQITAQAQTIAKLTEDTAPLLAEGVVTKLTGVSEKADTLLNLEETVTAKLEDMKLSSEPSAPTPLPFRVAVNGVKDLNVRLEGTQTGLKRTSSPAFKTQR